MLFLSLLLCICLAGAPPTLMSDFYHVAQHSAALANQLSAFNIPKAQAILRTMDQHPCVTTIGKALSQFYTNPTLGNILFNSGLVVNKFGRYLQCKSLKDFYYLTVALKYNAAMVMRINLCLPQNCSLSYMAQFRPAIANFLKPYLPFKIDRNNIIMMDIIKENQRLSKFEPLGWFYLIFALVWVFALLVMTALYHWKVMEPKDDELSLGKKVMRCFSLQHCFAGLISSKNKYDENLNVLDGIRVLAMLWILFGHAFLSALMPPVVNIQDFGNDSRYSYLYMFVKSGFIGVDIFFFLSGFLATLGFYNAFKRPDSRPFKVIIFGYIQRYIRLFPILLVTFVSVRYFLVRLYDSPTSPTNEYLAEKCSDQWPWYFLHVNNFITPMVMMCANWTWYLCNDMQFFIILPFFVLLYCKRRLFGLLAMFTVSTVCLIVQFAIAFQYGFSSVSSRTGNPDRLADYNNIYYIKPYCRIIPYLMGSFLFLVYEEAKDEEEGPRLFVLFRKAVCSYRALRYPVFYLLGLIVTALCIYSYYYLDRYSDSINEAVGTVHLVLIKPISIFGLMLMFYPILCGRGRIFFSFIAHPVFSFFGKLVYGVYMFQLVVVVLGDVSRYQAEYYEIKKWTMKFLRLTAISFLFSFVVTIIFESPIVMLLKVFCGRKTRPRNTEETEEDEQDKLKFN